MASKKASPLLVVVIENAVIAHYLSSAAQPALDRAEAGIFGRPAADKHVGGVTVAVYELVGNGSKFLADVSDVSLPKTKRWDETNPAQLVVAGRELVAVSAARPATAENLVAPFDPSLDGILAHADLAPLVAP